MCHGPQPNSLWWDLGQDGIVAWNGRSCKLSHSNDVIDASNDNLHVNVCGFTHSGCVVNGSFAIVAF